MRSGRAQERKRLVDSRKTPKAAEAKMIRHGLKQARKERHGFGAESSMSWVCEVTQAAEKDLRAMPEWRRSPTCEMLFIGSRTDSPRSRTAAANQHNA
jgi:hypothetical protein